MAAISSEAFPRLGVANACPSPSRERASAHFLHSGPSIRSIATATRLSLGARHRLQALASDGNDEWGEGAAEKKASKAGNGVGTAVSDEKEKDGDTEGLKKALLDSLYGTERGLKASSETRAEVNELITQLEAKNPTPAPTEALAVLNGKWILAYTSFSELFPLLAAGTLPLVKVGEISQTVDSNALTVQNSVSFVGPLATTSFSASASFEVRSPKRVQIKFEEGVIGTPQLTDSVELPDTVDFMGRKIDLTPAQDALRPLQDAANSVARTLSGQPPLKFSIPGNKAQSWLLTTYLDEDLRISRGDGGGVFLLVKEGSPLIPSSW
ncbi:hypothetical protein SELMODRAFT_163532 [Selaginella moellendorffii]|uniref:Plastid lipid-associated protein/fibrillin conserved domain-containing protein n=1 Tax=Selaginella moellendorffii TaxID=88036 RepID=D8QPE0_SELML|nr:probable plastid-lipid-associated protein 2, chloroplastic [Selaginella moellendorffii]EFJ38264.1 hypothetical protein SELMODRAFT_163532 [Selaginella moellendorffii]|eukprot:XP_002960725.1 probable plastid-lipid-associated protein 2, chloroplastic [Selaginella moellendorffii]